MGSVDTMSSWVSEIKAPTELADFGDAAQRLGESERALRFPARNWRERTQVLFQLRDEIEIYAPGERLFSARFEAVEATCQRVMLLNSTLEIYARRYAALPYNTACEALVLPTARKLRGLDPADAPAPAVEIADYKMAYAASQALSGARPPQMLIFQAPLIETRFGLFKTVRIPSGVLLPTEDELIYVEENRENRLGKNVYALRRWAIYASLVELESDRAVLCVTMHSGWKFRFYFGLERAEELKKLAATF